MFAYERGPKNKEEIFWRKMMQSPTVSFATMVTSGITARHEGGRIRAKDLYQVTGKQAMDQGSLGE